MFRKIVTELAYSPALAGNLGFYIKQLRNEVSKRQIGLIFVILAITIQLFTLAAPPESANANNPAIFIDGGVQSIDEYLRHYDQNTGNIMDLFNSLGITRPEVETAQLQELSMTSNGFIWSSQNSREEDSSAHSFQTINGKTSIAHYRPFQTDDTVSPAFVGQSTALGSWFAITKKGANLVTENPPPSPCTSWLSSPTNPLEVNSWSIDPKCLSKIDLALSTRAISSISPTLDTLHASDRIAYTLSMKNNTDISTDLIPSINLEDIVEYARILDYGGGSYDYDTRNLSWPKTALGAKGSIERTFIVQILPTIPSTPQGQYVANSYNCSVDASFGNSLSLPLDCPPAKHIEQMIRNLPQISSKINLITAVCLLAITVFLYARSRQLLSELYIIRHHHLGGL